MRCIMKTAAGLALAAALLALPPTPGARAEPLLTQGIGLANCGKLGPDLKPGEGLNHIPNALLFYWTQGYLSAANFFLLHKYSDYVDVSAVQEPVITQAVSDFCKANPDKQPISAIDKFIRDAPKVVAKKSDVMDFWEHTPPTPVAVTPAAPAAPAPPALPGMSSDDAKWIAQCVIDNRDATVKADVVLKYCTCMNDKMDDNETQSITQWEKTHPVERRACDRQAGWR